MKKNEDKLKQMQKRSSNRSSRIGTSTLERQATVKDIRKPSALTPDVQLQLLEGKTKIIKTDFGCRIFHILLLILVCAFQMWQLVVKYFFCCFRFVFRFVFYLIFFLNFHNSYQFAATIFCKYFIYTPTQFTFQNKSKQK